MKTVIVNKQTRAPVRPVPIGASNLSANNVPKSIGVSKVVKNPSARKR